MTLSRRLALALSAAALGPGARAARPAAAAPFICGAALPLSGVAGLQGNEILRGIQLAVDAVNAAGGLAGTPVQLLSADMPAPGDAAAAVNGLIAGRHAQLIFGSGDSALAYPASAAAELAQMPFIELTAPAEGILRRGFHYLLRTGPGSAMAAQVAVAALQERFAGRGIGLLYNSGTSGAAFAEALSAALAGSKLPVVLVAGYPETQEDLHDEVGRLMRAKVDVLLHAAGPDDALGLVLACRAQGWRPGVLIGTGPGYAYRNIVAALPDGLEGAYLIAAPFYPPAAQAVQAAYAASYGVAPRAADSLTAYVGARLVLDTLNGVNGDATKLLAALRGLQLKPGSLVNGFGAQFDRNGQNTGAFATLQRWRGGALEAV